MPQKILATARVRCSGKLHRISLGKNGKLIFHDHEHGLRPEHVAVALGTEPCRCLKVLVAWRICFPTSRVARLAEIPKELLPFLKKIHCPKRLQRKAVNTKGFASKFLNLKIPRLLRHVPRKYREAVMEAAKKCCYKNPATGLAHGRFWYEHINFNKSLGGVAGIVMCRGVLYLQPSWYRTVYQRGLAVMDGHLVLQVASETPESIEAIVACQHPESGVISPHKAYIGISPDGKPNGLFWPKK